MLCHIVSLSWATAQVIFHHYIPLCIKYYDYMSFHVMSFSWANQHFVFFWRKKSDMKKIISNFLSEKTFTFIFFTGLLRAHSVLIMCGYRPWIPSTFVFYPHETIMMEMRTKFSLVSFWESLRKEIDHLREYLKVLLYGKVFLSIFKVSFSKYFHSKVFLSKSIYSLQSEMNFPQEKIPPREMVVTNKYFSSWNFSGYTWHPGSRHKSID